MSENYPLQTSRELLRHFFMPIQGAHEGPDHYFQNTFVPPPELDNLVRRMTPTSTPRLLLWDGQSRVGKTWSAIGALAALLDRNLVDAVWTAGEDSHLVFDRQNTARPLTLLSAFRAIRKKLTRLMTGGMLQGRVVVLLDDFVGTARLRDLAESNVGLTELADYFAPELSRNLLLQCLRDLPSALVVITGRSSVFTSARVRLRLPIVPTEDRVSRGVFQTFDGTLIGEVDEPWLNAVISKHREYITNHEAFLFPPLAAFAGQAPAELLNEPQLPRILFGGDLAEFANEVEAAETLGFDQDIAEKLDDIYLLYVAPALMYPERAADEWLWSTGSAQALRDALYLHPGVKGLHLRVPNRFYLRAIATHLSQPRLALLARLLLRKLPKIDDTHHQRVLVRGFAERLLAREGPIAKDLSDDTMRLFDLAGDDPLLWWQRNALLSRRNLGSAVSAATVLARPGLASALGWSMITFPRVRGRIFFNPFLKAITEEVQSAVLNDNNAQPDDDLSRTIAVSYSNLLRWFAHDLNHKGYPRTIAELSDDTAPFGSTHRYPPRLSDLINMVFEDVLIWADELNVGRLHVRINRVPTGKRLLDELLADLRAPSSLAESEFGAWRLVNRLFSLTWHNEWMRMSRSYYKEVAAEWVESFMPVGIEFLKRKPELLSINLQYHWHHMLAQWAVWMRDWCFVGEHNPHHAGRPLGTSLDEVHNRAIRAVLGVVLEMASDATDIRNAFFLLGTRARYGESDTALLSTLSNNGATGGGYQARGCLQAIFELARQGFLDLPSSNTMGEQQRVHSATAAGEFRNACRMFLAKSTPEIVWKDYRSDLDNVTHLDVLPDSWLDVLPADWISVENGVAEPSFGTAVGTEMQPADRPD